MTDGKVEKKIPERPPAGKPPEKTVFDKDDIYKVLFELSPSGILLEDEKGNVIDANQVYCDSLGYAREEVIGKNVKMFTNPEKKSDVEKNIQMMLTGETLIHVEESIKKDGTSGFLRLHEKKIILPDGREGILCLTEDISERLKLEAQLAHAQKMESIGTLAGGIAHDFNNLLMGIQGNISLLLADSEKNSSLYKRLQNITDYIRRGEDLTKQLLGFAMKGKYLVKPLDMNSLIRKSSKMFGRTKKEIRIRFSPDKNLWHVEADHGQIEQVLLNLYINAWQAMENGGELHLNTSNTFLDRKFVETFGIKPGKYVRVSVSDTGIGMNREIMEKIFDPFFTTREDGKGTGLGLASAYGIIKNHGGIITVYSEPGKGSTFNFYLPATSKKIVKEITPDPKILSGNETILLVDDEEITLTVVRDMLEHMGYTVLTAGNGKNALNIYGKNHKRIDLVILDMIMPGMGGGTVFDRFMEIDPRVRVLLSSGFSLNGQASEILKKGCRGFIQKPFGIEQLSAKLREILGDGA